jgi:hypothetical protein
MLAGLMGGFGGLSLPGVLRLRAEGGTGEVRTTSLILLWQDGGPSPFETFDPKPEAPAEYRGELGAIATSLAGVQFCEVLPRLAALAHRMAVIRSMHQPHSGHPEGSRYFITGYADADSRGASAYPDVGAVVHRMRSQRERGLPGYVAAGSYAPGLHRGGAAYLGAMHRPFVVAGDPSQPGFRIDHFSPNEAIAAQRLAERNLLVGQLDSLPRAFDAGRQMEAQDGFRRRALEILTSPATGRAFDLDRETPAVRERYGMHAAGQQALLARRLVEAGVSVVALRFCPDGRGDGDKSGVGWDDHAVHGNIFQVMRRRGPQFDQAVSALVEDLSDRGLDRQVLVVAAGEFGRTPRISYANGETFNTGYGPGRDHWGGAGCALVFGGGIPMGQVIGATNRLGEFPTERAIQPQDLLATIYRFLGIDPRHEFTNLAGRPVPLLPFGTPIAELTG